MGRAEEAEWVVGDGAPNYIRYAGPLPASLYRYRSVSAGNIDRIIDFEIIGEAIFLAALGELNDPDEGRFRFVLEKDYEAALAYARAAISEENPAPSGSNLDRAARKLADAIADSAYTVPDRSTELFRYMLAHLVRVACFTTRPLNPAMWAHYAKYRGPDGTTTDAAGVCIEYGCDEAWRDTTLHPVAYGGPIPEINVLRRSEEEIVRAIYSKSAEWSYEDEWRITYLLDARPPFPANLAANARIRNEGTVKSVIFGPRAPDQMIETFKSRLTPSMPGLALKRVAIDVHTSDRRIMNL